jgi:hypothetical protein
MNAKAIFAILILSAANLSVAQELYLTCEGVKSTDITDRDAETRIEILKFQKIPPKKHSMTFIIKNTKVFSDGSTTELKNCNVSQYSIKCERPLTESVIPNWLFFYDLEIDRINGSIKERSGHHANSGKTNGQNSVQIVQSYFDGTCKKTNQLAF